jgi:hypothetical protein
LKIEVEDSLDKYAVVLGMLAHLLSKNHRREKSDKSDKPEE